MEKSVTYYQHLNWDMLHSVFRNLIVVNSATALLRTLILLSALSRINNEPPWTPDEVEATEPAVGPWLASATDCLDLTQE